MFNSGLWLLCLLAYWGKQLSLWTVSTYTCKSLYYIEVFRESLNMLIWYFCSHKDGKSILWSFQNILKEAGNRHSSLHGQENPWNHSGGKKELHSNRLPRSGLNCMFRLHHWNKEFQTQWLWWLCDECCPIWFEKRTLFSPLEMDNFLKHQY